MRGDRMKTNLDYKTDFLCVVAASEVADGPRGRMLVRQWYPIYPVEEAAARPLMGRPVRATDSERGIYVDEEGNIFQLRDKGETKPIAVEHLPASDKTELEVLLEASLKEERANGKNGGAKRLWKKNRRASRRNAVATNGTPASRADVPVAAVSSASNLNADAWGSAARLNLHQKLAEVRRR